MKKIRIVLFCGLLPFFSMEAADVNSACPTACQGAVKAEPGSLTLPAEQWVRLWMDEIVARDLYAELQGMTQRPIFKNIGKAEVHHRKMIETLLTSSGVELPEAPQAGTYPDEELQTFYDQKLKSGKASEMEAFKSGEAFEIQDIAELEAALKTEGLSEAEKSLLTALVAASNRHLSAFQRQLGK